LLGSLLVGSSFAKGLSISLDVPLIEVHHMQAHVLAHWIRDVGDGPEASKSSADSEGQVPGPGPNRAKHNPQTDSPNFPFLCLTVSGGHTQIVRVDGPQEFTELGSTLDDAAGEAFDKVSKIMGLPYPGGPVIDKLAKEGNPKAFEFSRANVPFPNYSFSGLKTGVLYFLRKEIEKNPNFIEENKADICASVQRHIVSYLLDVFAQVVEKEGITDLGLAGGVSANSELRSSFISLCESCGWRGFIPKFEYCTDNAAMIGIAGQFLFEEHREGSLGSAPKARLPI
jgi:N6-L-threonylcarbamoyladenine synthase